jgi:chorismate-pyruvate lyase
MKADLHSSLTRNNIDLCGLSPFQRIIMTTDGTLTDLLEAYFLEAIQLVKLSEELVTTTEDIIPLELEKGRNVIERQVLLQGKISKSNFIYAKSIIIPDRLEEKFRNRLVTSKIPIGRLWLEHKMETYKEIVEFGKEKADELYYHFKLKKEDDILFRNYRLFNNRKPIMTITEKFPASYFQNNF